MFRAKWIYSTSEGFDDAKALRREVFVAEQGYECTAILDDMDAISACVIVLAQDGVACATGRLHPHDCWLFGRICVKEGYRGQGYGELVVKLLAQKAIETAPSALLGVNSATGAVGFYRSFGFEPSGEPFVKDGVEVQPMRVSSERFDFKKTCSKNNTEKDKE